MYDVYIANALFSDADRAFNRLIADELVKAGFAIFLPQDSKNNHSLSPTEMEIFESDTRSLLDSRALLAVLDQETIDAGVACEIGIAVQAGITVIGLITDIRLRRNGPGKIYKNPYVTGAILSSGRIVTSVQEACTALLSTIGSVNHDT